MGVQIYIPVARYMLFLVGKLSVRSRTVLIF